MENVEFKKLLFKVACCTMICDGEMHQSEIDELRLIKKSTAYFSDVDLSEEFLSFLEDAKINGVKVINDLFLTLKSIKFNPIQELLFLEIAIRIINADNVQDESEIRYIRHLRSHLDLHNEVIKDRFGSLTLLGVQDFNDIKNKQTSINPAFDEIIIPEFIDFDGI